MLTAAHCLLREFEYEHDNKSYVIRVRPNKYYPSYESMFEVYLGLHNKSAIDDESFVFNDPSSSVIKLGVEEVILVCIL